MWKGWNVTFSMDMESAALSRKLKGFKVLALLNSGPSQNNDDWAICYASSFFYEHSKIHVPSTMYQNYFFEE